MLLTTTLYCLPQEQHVYELSRTSHKSSFMGIQGVIGHIGCFIRAYVRKKSFLSILMYMNHFFNTHIVRKTRLNKYAYEEKLQVNIRILKRNNCCLNSYIFSYVYMIGAIFLSNFLKLSRKLSCYRCAL